MIGIWPTAPGGDQENGGEERMTQLYQPSPALAGIVGDTPLSWVKIIELVGDHIRENNLEAEPLYIHTDAALPRPGGSGHGGLRRS